MHGKEELPVLMFSYVNYEGRVPSQHPLRMIRAIVDEALEMLSATFERLYASHRRSLDSAGEIAARVAIAGFYGIRSERQLGEQMNYNRLFRWFASCRWMRQPGMPAASARTATACLKVMSPGSF
jgi:transposase